MGSIVKTSVLLVVLAVFLPSIISLQSTIYAAEPDAKGAALEIEKEFLNQLLAIQAPQEDEVSAGAEEVIVAEEIVFETAELGPGKIGSKAEGQKEKTFETGRGQQAASTAENPTKPLWLKPTPQARLLSLYDDLMAHGKSSYRRGEYLQAKKDFEAALTLNFNNGEAQKWDLKADRALRKSVLQQKKQEYLDDTELAELDKETRERKWMLELESAYKPAEKTKDVKVRLFGEPEAAAEEEVLAGLREKTVPAISLTEADIRDVIHQLMKMTQVTIILDERALTKATSDKPLKITFTTVNPMPLLDILEISLKTTGLDYKVEDNYIWISDIETLSKEKMVTTTYKLQYGTRRIRKVDL